VEGSELKNSQRADRAVEGLYRTWIEQNTQRLAEVFRDRFGTGKEGKTVYSQKEFHDFVITEALVGLRVIDPEFFRAILVDHLINTHYNLNRVVVDKDWWSSFFAKKNEKK
jgi:hypothetical protein